jgi:cystathionine gamma-synthase
MRNTAALRPETIAALTGRPTPVPDGPLNAPIVPASALHPGESGYARSGSPGWTALEEALGCLEGGSAVCFNAGISALNAAIRHLPAGAKVVGPRFVYRGVREAIQHMAALGALRVSWVDTTDTEATMAACEDADALILESPANPMMTVTDLPALCGFARERGIYCVVDSTMVSPLGQDPLQLGADVVLHSLTKWVGGHTDLLMGALTTRDPDLVAKFGKARQMAGTTPGALECYLALRGLRTLPLRFNQADRTARELARRLRDHPDVARVRHPGLPDDPSYERARTFMKAFGGVFSLEVRGGAERADAVVCHVRLFVHATSFGGVNSTLERRARWRGEVGVPEELIRVSVGIEHVEDLWADLEQALAASAAIPAAAGPIPRRAERPVSCSPLRLR